MTISNPPLLSRAGLAERGGRTAVVRAPVRIVHVGLGAFHRAHQAWYTARSSDAEQWGIAAFTGRNASAAVELAPQDGLYTLIERSADEDRASVLGNIVEVWDGARLDRFAELVAAPATALITLTITESGYRLRPDGSPDASDPVVAEDLRLLSSRSRSETPVVSTLARVVVGLDARRVSDSGPIAIVPCDNLPGNGELVRTGIRSFAGQLSSALVDWIDENVSFVSTSVDRITPRTVAADREIAEGITGWRDNSPVVTEPFSDWVLSGDFPAGRPRWETAGARFVDDIEPFEKRKLWLLNGAHSMLALTGMLRGHRTVADAITDDDCRAWVTDLWHEAVAHLSADDLELADYCAALLNRFENGRIEHSLEQIAVEGASKLRFRIVPVATAERAAGRDAKACARVIASWIALLRLGWELADGSAEAVERAMARPESEQVRALIELLDEALAQDSAFLATVGSLVEEACAQTTDAS